MHQIDIINLALTRLGQSSVTSLTEGSTEAASAARVWGAALRATLEEFRWGFNTRRAVLPLKAEKPMGAAYAYAYGVPADLVRPYEIFQEDVTCDRPIPFLYEGGLIYTDQPGAVLVYGALEESAEAFPPLFCDALAWRLASELAAPLTMKASLMEYASNRYELGIHRARTSAGNARHPRDDSIPGYIRARG